MNSTVDPADDVWEPPSEAEMKAIQERRERSDKISKLMGDYLLKGYKMLSSVCDVCGTILLQDRQKSLHCVGCKDMEMEATKDNPAVKPGDACKQTVKSQQQQPDHRDNTEHISSSSYDYQKGAEQHAFTVRESQQLQPLLPSVDEKKEPARTRHMDTSETQLSLRNCEMSLAAVQQKMKWAAQELTTASSIEASIQLANLIKSCADAMCSLQKVVNNLQGN